MDLPRVVTVATDGSALRNPNGPAGWCWFADSGSWASGGWERNSNNAAELNAVLQALLATAHLEGVTLVLETDSRYAIDACTRWVHGWQRRGWVTSSGSPVANADLVRAVVDAASGRDVVWRWVRGHNGHARNESADARAQAAARAIGAGRDFDRGPGWTRP